MKKPNNNKLAFSLIGEIIVNENSLKTSERKDIEQYLGKKWGIKVN